MVNPIKKTIELSDGRTITLETGKLAKQADGAVELRMGNTMLLATVVSAKEAGEGVDFMPLQVEYKEKFSSAGRFPGGFLKREGRASDYEILTARLVDRVLRPLFPDNYHADTFVNVTMYSSDGVDMPDALAGLAASAAIALAFSLRDFQSTIVPVLIYIIAESEIVTFTAGDHLRREFFLYFRFECLVEYIRYGLCYIDVT